MMENKKLAFYSFCFVAVIQLAIPLNIILERELILVKGKAVKFETAPVDPYDPFRGKYINLSFSENSIAVDSSLHFEGGEKIYLIIEVAADSVATVKSVQKTKPEGSEDFIKAQVDYVSSESESVLYYRLPFHTFYMEESKAYEAELAYFDSNWRSSNDSLAKCYALVYIRDGESSIKNVLIGNRPIADIARERINAKKEEN
jgi:uncharacterized membrane-anchored protein